MRTLLYSVGWQWHCRALLVDREKSCDQRQIVQIIQAINFYLILTSLFIEDNFMILINLWLELLEYGLKQYGHYRYAAMRTYSSTPRYAP